MSISSKGSNIKCENRNEKHSPRGRMKKNGSQKRMKAPTTMPKVCAALFSRLNRARRAVKGTGRWHGEAPHLNTTRAIEWKLLKAFKHRHRVKQTVIQPVLATFLESNPHDVEQLAWEKFTSFDEVEDLPKPRSRN